ncbi:hypothetical protein [Candidatus Nitrosocosmicus franklandus]|uniref:hypothetical protein n=1 Tax=Candidatus Nitrosocosmicus franklandianus TaxID=1798806 RepID=UPI0010694E5F|nr:hypothetical protein [Candidatus Nitrosocosmicus franklandus]
MRTTTHTRRNKNTKILVTASVAMVVTMALFMGSLIPVSNAELTTVFKLKQANCPDGWIKLPSNLNPQLGDCMPNTLKTR